MAGAIYGQSRNGSAAAHHYKKCSLYVWTCQRLISRGPDCPTWSVHSSGVLGASWISLANEITYRIEFYRFLEITYFGTLVRKANNSLVRWLLAGIYLCYRKGTMTISASSDLFCKKGENKFHATPYQMFSVQKVTRKNLVTTTLALKTRVEEIFNLIMITYLYADDMTLNIEQ